MTWHVKAKKENNHAVVDLTMTDYTRDTVLLPAEARKLASMLYNEANECDRMNRPPVRRIGEF